MKFWLFASVAAALVTARAVYRFKAPGSSRRSPASDQVSTEWLATAKIHEDQG